MFEDAARLSEGLPFVCVTRYNVNGKICFGEMAFYPASGFDEKLRPKTDIYYGKLKKLDK